MVVRSGMQACLSILRRELRRAAVRAELVIQLVRARLYRHARAVESLREEDLLAAQPVVGAGELELQPPPPPVRCRGQAEPATPSCGGQTKPDIAGEPKADSIVQT